MTGTFRDTCGFVVQPRLYIPRKTHPMTALRFVLTLCILLAAAPAPAQDYQPGRAPHTSVAETLTLPVVNHPVVLTGYLVNKTGDETYVFQDDTGRLQAKVSPEALYNITVDGKRLTVHGTVGRQGDTVEIAVDAVAQAE